MKVGIVDAELNYRQRHRFPNLACMKLSSYHKKQNDTVELITAKEFNPEDYDKIYLSKIFTDTVVPDWLLNAPNVEKGGTGFFLDKAPPLPYEIEHIMPDYHLYDEYVNAKLEAGERRVRYEYFLDYSFGFLTRGCIRQCPFCVNKNYKKCSVHSPLEEFFDPSRKWLCFLDDNFFACPQWKEIIQTVIDTGRRFIFKQGLDERLLTEEKCQSLATWKYDKRGFLFAFDDIRDKEIIEEKLQLLMKYFKYKMSHIKFFVLCGFDRNDKYDEDFWIQDIRDTFERVSILWKYGCLSYIMRYEKCYTSPYAVMYNQIAGWCNNPQTFAYSSFYKFCTEIKGIKKDGHKGVSWLTIDDFIIKHPDIAAKYFFTR